VNSTQDQQHRTDRPSQSAALVWLCSACISIAYPPPTHTHVPQPSQTGTSPAAAPAPATACGCCRATSRRGRPLLRSTA
jgi:hypothetical protein